MTKREVKMDGYWPSSLFCVFMDQDEIEVHKNARNERGQHSAILTKQAWSIKDLSYGQKIKAKNFAFAGTKREIQSGQERAHHARLDSQSEHRIRFILPARGASHIINIRY